MVNTEKPVFRFAPSPNGELHIGHAFSALLNLKLARLLGGKMLLRIEDIDHIRCTPEKEAQMLKDLEWIGFEWDEAPRRQSEHMEDYQTALDTLITDGSVFPSVLSRSEIRELVRLSETPKSDPDGAPLYPGTEHRSSAEKQQYILSGDRPFALRLDVDKLAPQEIAGWLEITSGKVFEDPREWGKPIIARKETPTSYHLSCIVDDAIQGVTHVVRGMDLFHATSLHTLLQTTLKLPHPIYHHHALMLNASGAKLSKSNQDTSLRQLREAGRTVESVHEQFEYLFQDDQFYQACTDEQTNHNAGNN